MESSSAQRSGTPNSPLSFPCPSNREFGARALSGVTLRTQAISRAPHLLDKFKTRPTSSRPFGNRKNIHIPWASDPDAQLGEPMDQNKLEVLSTRENGRQFHPFSSSEMTGSFQLRPFDRLFMQQTYNWPCTIFAWGATTARVREPGLSVDHTN